MSVKRAKEDEFTFAITQRLEPGYNLLSLNDFMEKYGNRKSNLDVWSLLQKENESFQPGIIYNVLSFF